MTAPTPTIAPTIDLNCDLGEGVIDDATELALLDLVTSANIACAGHAGDEKSMDRLVRACMTRGVAIGAHPSFPDRAGFGRTAIDMPAPALQASVLEQIDQLWTIARARGGWVSHIKPHGALYHAAMTSPPLAEAIALAARSLVPDAILVGQSGTPGFEAWNKLGRPVAAEGFADRRYEPSGKLRSRTLPDSLIEDPVFAADQAVRIATGSPINAFDGSQLTVTATTICIHSDTPGALAIARAVRDALLRANIRLSPP